MTGWLPKEADLVELIFAAQDGTISDSQFAELENRLKASSRARELYVYLMDMHAGLICLEDMCPLDVPEKIRLAAQRNAGSRSLRGRQSTVWRMLTHPYFHVVLCVLFVSLGYQAYRHVAQALAPQEVAVVSTTSNGTLRASGKLYVVNDHLETGRQYELGEGLLELQMDSGVEVLISGPTTFQLLSSNSLRLLQGTLTADVPRIATGFAVLTPTLKAVDLGTRFGVHVNPEGVSQTHVFKGVVNCFGVNGGQVDLLPTRLIAGESVKRKSGREFSQSQKETTALFAEHLQHQGGIRKISGDIKFLPVAPDSVAGGKLTSDQHIQVFLERENFVLPEDVECSVPDEGQNIQQQWKDGVIKKGLTVSVFYIHFDDHRLGHPDYQVRLKSLNLKGVIQFGSKIRGILGTNSQLRLTDPFLGIPGTQYLKADGGKRERDRTADDGAALFSNGQALRLGWGLGGNDAIGGIDAMRVIVADP